ncbi:MAG TPA: 5-dehydro-2-deoxygluconokinase, partial [Deltaproteobacteria bacterium]|nr:5-dehydro-2-deoxygluconokinase [Deltaproteobacteria bacterium]
EYFIRDFDDVPDLVHHPKMEQLHLRTELGQPQKQELLILAYDHRTQFEDSCRENGLSLDSISRFKELVYEGFQKVYRTMEEYGCAVLIDPEYGETILKNSADTDYVIGVP